MSWLNPTSDEAAESYSYYKNKYYNAANQKRTSEKQEQSYVSQKKSATSKMNALSTQKVNLEKRLSGIVNIIKMLEGTGGWFSANVPNAISKATSALNKTIDSYRSCIKMSGVVAASLKSAFISRRKSDVNESRERFPCQTRN